MGMGYTDIICMALASFRISSHFIFFQNSIAGTMGMGCMSDTTGRRLSLISPTCSLHLQQQHADNTFYTFDSFFVRLKATYFLKNKN